MIRPPCGVCAFICFDQNQCRAACWPSHPRRCGRSAGLLRRPSILAIGLRRRCGARRAGVRGIYFHFPLRYRGKALRASLIACRTSKAFSQRLGSCRRTALLCCRWSLGFGSAASRSCRVARRRRLGEQCEGPLDGNRAALRWKAFGLALPRSCTTARRRSWSWRSALRARTAPS